MFWESNPTNIKSPSGKCSASNGNASAELGKGRSISSEDFTGRGEGIAEGGGRVAAGGAVVAAARWDSTPLPLFASRKATGDELAHLRDFGFGEQLDGGGFVGGDDGFGGVPVEVGEVWVGGVFGVG